MFKLAHSISIAFGFMVACVQALCGATNSFSPDCVFTSEPRGVAKIYSQIFKNLASKKQTTDTPQRRLSRTSGHSLSDYLTDLSQSYAVEFENSKFKYYSNFTICNKTECIDEFLFLQKYSKAHPIRAPSSL